MNIWYVKVSGGQLEGYGCRKSPATTNCWVMQNLLVHLGSFPQGVRKRSCWSALAAVGCFRLSPLITRFAAGMSFRSVQHCCQSARETDTQVPWIGWGLFYPPLCAYLPFTAWNMLKKRWHEPFCHDPPILQMPEIPSLVPLLRQVTRWTKIRKC